MNIDYLLLSRVNECQRQSLRSMTSCKRSSLPCLRRRCAVCFAKLVRKMRIYWYYKLQWMHSSEIEWASTRKCHINGSFHMASSSGTVTFAVLSLLLICTIHVVSSQNVCTCSGSCMPSPEDIAGKFAVTSNSTCGDPVEQYCVGADCSKVCNAKDNGLKHPANYTNDAFSLKTFWKSKNYEFPVYLQIDTGALFVLYQSVITFQHELPAAMYLAKSKDFGATFSKIAFFSSDCRAFFNMGETPDNKKDGLKVECFKIDPVLNSNKQVSMFRVFFSVEVLKYEPNSFTVYRSCAVVQWTKCHFFLIWSKSVVSWLSRMFSFLFDFDIMNIDN